LAVEHHSDTVLATKPCALVLAPEAPYPLVGGGALRSASLIEYLARSFEVDLVVFRQPGAADPIPLLPVGLLRRVSVIDLPPNRRGAVARHLRNAVRVARRVPPLIDRFAGFQPQVAAAIGGQHYELGIIEHFWCAPYWEQVAGACARTVLDLHNLESVLHARCAEVEAGTTGLAHRIFCEAAAELEREWIPRFSDVLTASSEDRTAVLSLAPGARVTVYPNAIPLPPLPTGKPEEAIVFSGNLEYHPNISAVRFFRQQVWPLLRDRWPALEWRLVGKNPDAVKAWTAGDPRIVVTGPVRDAISQLARAKVAVVPVLAGSGTRLKILEAWAAGVPVVSTRLGAEGLPVEDRCHLLLADGPAEFAEAVSCLLEDASLRDCLGRSGRSLLEAEFTWEMAWRHLDWVSAAGAGV
jgi:glycosyltransferase involved in cell wall biosynthesis